MPTNILRRQSDKRASAAPKSQRPVDVAGRRITIVAGPVTIRAELIGTEAAARIWAALPLYSTAEAWGAAIHFKTPIESGRERGAKVVIVPGEIGFWSEEDRVIIAYGTTPTAQRGEIRLPVPCTIWARALDDVTLLNRVVPGEKVSVTAA